MNLKFHIFDNCFIGKFKKNVLVGAHKKFKRVQQTETYLLSPKVQDKRKMKLPLDMVSKHVYILLYLQHAP